MIAFIQPWIWESLTGSPPDAKEMDCMWWLAIICEKWNLTKLENIKKHQGFQKWSPLTCLPSGVMRLRLLVEMFRLMDIPANCRLLFPRMLDRVLDGGWKERSVRYYPSVSKKAVKDWALRMLLFGVLMKPGEERRDKISRTHSDASVWSWCHICHGGKTTLSYISDVLWQRC